MYERMHLLKTIHDGVKYLKKTLERAKQGKESASSSARTQYDVANVTESLVANDTQSALLCSSAFSSSATPVLLLLQ
jgi:hypothetical protein